MQVTSMYTTLNGLTPPSLMTVVDKPVHFLFYMILKAYFLDLKNIFHPHSYSKFIRVLSVPAWNTALMSGVLHLLLTS